MNFPSDTIKGSPTFHTRIEKQPDGSYKATANVPGIGSVAKPTESEAILAIRAKAEAYFGGGGK